MALSSDEVRHLFALARLADDADTVERVCEDFEAILAYMSHLRDVDVAGLEPMTHGDIDAMVLRDDVPRDSTPIDEAFREAPLRDDHVRVPRVIGEGSP